MAAPLSMLIFTASLIGTITLWIVLTGRGSTSFVRWAVSYSLPLLMAGYGLKRRSLDSTAAALAVLVGTVLTLANGCFCSSLIVFFITGSRLTKWKKKEKQKFEPDEESVTRDWKQVFCNGSVASAASLLYLYSTGMGEQPLIIHKTNLYTWCSLACLASISCCCGDTWASEIGSAVSLNPRLVTTLRSVPRGTNGGVSLPGLLASGAGGVLIGVTYYITSLLLVKEGHIEWIVIPASLFAGLFGSLVDSVLGATLQYSGFNRKTGKIAHSPGPNVEHVTGWNILSNNTVNLLSSLITGLVTPWLLVQIMK